ncbi:MAG TPA: hypothetical protein PLF38_08420, partial [Xylanibacter oryzae]|nr:hypothetical protein [Xylanibacter oryzae]
LISSSAARFIPNKLGSYKDHRFTKLIFTVVTISLTFLCITRHPMSYNLMRSRTATSKLNRNRGVLNNTCMTNGASMFSKLVG